MQVVLFLDVDGPLIPFGTRPASCPNTVSYAVDVGDNPLVHRLDPTVGPRLLALGCDLVWATTWAADANDVIGPRIGLPELPVAIWPDLDDDPADGLHWKTRTLVDWAAGRPFVWVDDEVTDADRRWVSAHHPGPALLHRVDPRCGLLPADFAAISAWLSGPDIGQQPVEGTRQLGGA